MNTDTEKKNPAIGAGYSQTNTSYLQEDLLPSGPPITREEIQSPCYSTFPVVCKTGDEGWVDWIQLMDGLYEYIGKYVPPEEEQQLVYDKRQTLIERLKALQEEHVKKTEMEGQNASTTQDTNVGPSVKRSEEYSDYSCEPYEAVSMENMPGVTVTKS